MTNAEWRPMARQIASCWRGEFTPAQAEDYFEFLEPYPAEGVRAALHMLVQDPKPFVPSVSEIVGAMRRIVEKPVPGWTEVREAIFEALLRARRHRVKDEYDPERGLTRAAELAKQVVACEWLAAEVHPVVARFFEGETYARLRKISFEDEQYGGIRIAELRQRWEDFVDVARERQRQGLAIEAATGGRSEIEALHPLDFAALLRPTPERKQIGEGS